MRGTSRPLAALALTALTAASLTTAPAQAAPAEDGQADGPTKIQVVLDSSGSMRQPDGAGGTKIESARQAVTRLAESVPADVQLGLRVFGATEKVVDENKPSPAACQDTQQVVAPATGNRDAIKAAAAKFTPVGYTPTVAAVKGAIADLGADGNRHIVLVSDGEVSCSPDPCAEIKKLTTDAGVTVQIDTIGMSLEGKARSQLQCIAQVTGGSYYDVDSADDMAGSLDKVTQRAARGYELAGAPITGGDAPASAVDMAPGKHVDNLAVGQKRYYKVAVPQGASLWARGSAKPSPSAGVSASGLNLSLSLPSGTTCSHAESASDVALGGEARTLQSSAVTWDPKDSGRNKSTEAGCSGAPEMILEVERFGSASSDPASPVELELGSTPWPSDAMGSVTGLTRQGFASLPAPRAASDESQLPLPAKVQPSGPVAGGTSFSNAVELKPGTVTDTLAVGESLVYKVKLDWGQSATLGVVGTGKLSAVGRLRAYGPQGRPIAPWGMSGDVLDPDDSIGGQHTDPIAAYVPPVRANNRFVDESKVNGMADDGYAYFVLSTGPDPAAVGEKATMVPVTLSLRVDGAAGEGKPTFDAAASDTSASPSADPTGSTGETPSGSPSPTEATTTAAAERHEGGEADAGSGVRQAVVVGGAALGLALVGGGAYWALRRRR